MQVGFVGLGRTGMVVAKRMYDKATEIERNWGIRILAGNPQDDLSVGVVGLNTDDADSASVRGLPNKILIPSGDRFEGTGSGRDARFTAALMEKEEVKQQLLARIKERTTLTLNAQAIMVAASADGGTGGGGIWGLVPILKQLSTPPLPVYVILFLPFASLEKNTQRMENTMECLKVLVEGMGSATPPADATILIHNQQFVNNNESLDRNYDRIDGYVVNFLGPLLAAPKEERGERLGGDLLDVRELMGVLHGPCAIGMGRATVPRRRGSFWRARTNRYWMDEANQTQLTRVCLEDAFGNLSIGCFDSESGARSAVNGLCLLTSSQKVVTPTVLAAVGDVFGEQCPGPLQSGVHPVGNNDELEARIILGGVAGSEMMDTLLRLIRIGVEKRREREANEKGIGGKVEDLQARVRDLQGLTETTAPPSDGEA